MLRFNYLTVCFFLLFVITGFQVKSKQSKGQSDKSTILNVLNQTIEVPISKFQKSCCKVALPADISFMFADIKYIKGQIKICEFGPGNLAGAHEDATPLKFDNNTLRLRAPYWSFFWYYLSSLNLPVWFVGKHPNTATSKWLRAKNVHWNLYKKLGGYYSRDIGGLEKHARFKDALQKTKKFDSSKLETYRGIVLFRTTKRGYKKKLKNFKSKYPQFIVIDEHTMRYSLSKFQGASLFNHLGLEKFKPQWGWFSSQYSSHLSHEIIQKIKSDFFVIKPPDANQSSGVILTTKKKLNKTLRFILSPIRAHPHTYSYWKKKKRAKHFLVEEYCPSKKIKVRGKWYDPTMRLFFLLRSDNQKLYITVTGGFWKIPNKSLADNASLTDKHITIHGGTGRIALPIDSNDLHDARTLLQTALPGLYFNMLNSKN